MTHIWVVRRQTVKILLKASYLRFPFPLLPYAYEPLCTKLSPLLPINYQLAPCSQYPVQFLNTTRMYASTRNAQHLPGEYRTRGRTENRNLFLTYTVKPLRLLIDTERNSVNRSLFTHYIKSNNPIRCLKK